MKFKTINWKQHEEFPDNYRGFIDEHEVFTIVNVGRKDQVFQLKSWPLHSTTFHVSATSKYLGEFSTLSLAQVEAQLKWEEFTNSLLEKVENHELVTNELVHS